MAKIIIYDTTLRDGAQAEEVSFSVEDKLLITQKLDELGVHYVEGGYPGANPRDEVFFEKAKKLRLKKAKLAAFGATHHPGHKPAQDPTIKGLLNSGAPVATVFGKTWDFHVKHALRIPYERNLEVIHDTLAYLKKRLDTVFFDAEHFFDGYLKNPGYAIKCLEAAVQAGADCLVLCETNGGVMPSDVGRITAEIKKNFSTEVGIHAHNDSECGVANSVMAVEAGARHVQGTMNGLGERAGNGNLCSIIPNLELKLGHQCIGASRLKKLRTVSRFINEISNLMPLRRQPFVGDSAFAHKAGIHVSAILKNPETYEHIRPELVGNSQRVLVSDLSGKSNILRKAEDFGIKMDPDSREVKELVSEVKELENQGFQFEGAEASLELLIKKKLGMYKKLFEVSGFRVFISKRSEADTALHEATVILKVEDSIEHTAASGNGPVNALDNALRKALVKFYSKLSEVELLDYKVRVLTTGKGTAANVRVLIESGDSTSKWVTVGVSEDVVEASYQALVDSIEYKLHKRN